MKQEIKAEQTGHCFSVTVPESVEWVLEFESFRGGKLKNGSLVVVEHYDGPDGHDGVGWVVRVHKNFDALLKDGDYYDGFHRALAHALGIEKLKWRGIWLATDDYLCDYPNEDGELKALQRRRAKQLEAAGCAEKAAAFRKQAGL